MNYKIYLCTFCTLLSAYALSAIHFEKMIKKNKIIETKILYFILSFVLGYLLTEFLVLFLPEGIWKIKFS